MSFILDPEACFVSNESPVTPRVPGLTLELLLASMDPDLRFLDILRDEQDGEYYAYFIDTTHPLATLAGIRLNRADR